MLVAVPSIHNSILLGSATQCRLFDENFGLDRQVHHPTRCDHNGRSTGHNWPQLLPPLQRGNPCIARYF